MAVKKSSVSASVEANTKAPAKKVTPTTHPESTKKKGCIDSCIENPGFPWMVIAILFTLLVIMFWREHYNYWMGRMHNSNGYNKEWRMDDDRYRPIMNEEGGQMRMMDSESTPPAGIQP